MNLQELLVYIEELGFKNSMFGYDKNEVDDELDKICDTIEELVKNKEAEIESLKKQLRGEGIEPQEPIIVDAQEAEDAREAARAAEEEAQAQREAAMNAEAEKEALIREASEKEEALRAAAAEKEEALKSASATEEELRHRLAMVEAELDQERERADAAEERERKAVEECQDALDRLAKAEEQVREYEEEYEEEEEVVDMSREMPETKDEAYQMYMRNADLLCKQLSMIDAQEAEVIAKANEEAEGIIAQANADSEGIIADARQQAEFELKGAESQKATLEEQIRQLTEDRDAKLAEEKEVYEELVAKKESVLASIRTIAEETKQFADKYDF